MSRKQGTKAPRVRLGLELLEARDVPAVALPQGFTAYAGDKLASNVSIIAGEFNGTPAYFSVMKELDGSFTVNPNMQILPSVSSFRDGTTGNSSGRILEVNGLNFFGESALDIPNTTTIATRWGENWDVDEPITLSDTQTSSAFNEGTANTGFIEGISVGSAIGLAIIRRNGVTMTLSNQPSTALDVTKDGTYVVGQQNGRVAAWRYTASNAYELITLTVPANALPLGKLFGVVDHFASGTYFDQQTGKQVAGIWDLKSGALLQSLSSYGEVIGTGELTNVGREIVAIFNGATGQSPLVHYIRANRSFALGADSFSGLTGDIPGGRVIDAWAFGTEMAVVAADADGKQFFTTFSKDDQNKNLGGLPPVELPYLFWPSDAIEISNSTTLIGGSYQGRAAYLTVTVTDLSNPYTISEITYLPSYGEIEFGSEGSARGRVTNIIKRADGAFWFVGYSADDKSGYGNDDGFDPYGVWTYEPNSIPRYVWPSGQGGIVLDINDNLDIVGYTNAEPGVPIPLVAVYNGYAGILPNVHDGVDENYAGYAGHISEDSQYIVGVENNYLVYWSNTAGGQYIRHQLFDEDNFWASSRLWWASLGVSGEYAAAGIHDIVAGVEVESRPVVWRLSDGKMIAFLEEYSTWSELRVQMTKAGDETVVFWDDDVTGDPIIYLVENERAFRLSEVLPVYTGLERVTAITKIWDRGDGTLGIIYQHPLTGYAVVQVIEKNDLGERWDTIELENQPPTNLALSNATVAENLAAGAIVGALSATDPEGDAITYSIQTNGVPFAVQNGKVVTTASLNFEARAAYSLTLRATDSKGAFVDTVFEIRVGDVVELTGITINNGYAGRSNLNEIRVTFDSAANAQLMLSSGAIRFRREGFAGNLVVPAGRITLDGNSIVYNLKGIAAFAVNGRYFVEADLDRNGSFETRRFAARRLLGDVDGNGIVNRTDFYNVLYFLRIRTYNPNTDLDSDGQITSRDLMIMWYALSIYRG